MAGKSKLTANAAEQAVLRALSKSEHRGEADRARAILLTWKGGAPRTSPPPLGCTSARCATGRVTLRMAEWRGYDGARSRDSPLHRGGRPYMAIAADMLNRMLELGRPEYVRIA